MTIRILGNGVYPAAQALQDVCAALEFDRDVVLLPHMAPFMGKRLENVAIYNMEPLYDGCRSLSNPDYDYLNTLKRCHVLDYSKNNIEYLKQFGVEAFHLPYGYHPSLERVNPVEKDIDILFFGSVNARRNAVLTTLFQEFKFVWARGYYGKDLDKLIARAKVHLNIHFCESHQLEVVRLNYLMANHCSVVSEAGNEQEVNDKYSPGLLFCHANNLVETCKYALNTMLSGYEVIKSIPMNCGPANEWLNRRIQ